MNNSYTNQSLSIILFNAYGLKNHVNEVHTVLYDKRIVIALITETHFIKHSYISVPGYSLLKSNHLDGTAHGGVTLIIKYCAYQACAIKMSLNNIPFVIAAVYCPPRHNLTNHNLTISITTSALYPIIL
jgi:hypothetical protein